MKKRNAFTLLILFIVIFSTGWFLGKRDSVLWVWLADSPVVAESEEDVHRQNPHLPSGRAADGVVSVSSAVNTEAASAERVGSSRENHFLPSGRLVQEPASDGFSGYSGRASSNSYMIPAPETGTSVMVCAYKEMLGRATDNRLGQLQNDFAEQGANVSFWVLDTQEQAVDAFVSGHCSGALLSAAAARSFNRFAATVDALGAISKEQFGKLTELLVAGRLDKYLRQGDYEVVGIWLMMPQYLIVRGQTASLGSLQGRNFSAIKGNAADAAMIRNLGANTVIVRSEASAYGKYSAGAVDVMMGSAWLPDRDYQQRLGSESRVYYFRQGVVTAQLVLRVSDVSDEIKKQLKSASTALSLSHLHERERQRDKYGEGTLGIFYPAEKGTFSEAEWAEWEELLRNARWRLVEKGVYSTEMLALLKKLRCKNEPARQECMEGGQ